MVFAHGNMVVAEDHMGVPMIMASHGYLVLSPTFADGTAKFAKDVKGNDVWPREANSSCPPKMLPNKKPNMAYWDDCKKGPFPERV